MNALERKTIFQRRHGAILLNVLVFMIVISIMIAGMALLIVSDDSIGRVESNYALSLGAAEAGINYELRKISDDATTADQKQLTGAPGISYTTPAGTFSVYVTQRNSDGSETTPWVPGQNLWVYSTGGVGKLKRTVKVAAVPISTGPPMNYAIFGGAASAVSGTTTVVNGDIGTNSLLTVGGQPTINGHIMFDGPLANWLSLPVLSYPFTHNPNPVVWPTVEAMAITAFGSQGLGYVAAHNDNALAIPPVVGNVGTGNRTFVGKPGGANYYLTSLSVSGQAQVAFDNANGPITIWVGPSGGSGSFSIQGGTAAVKMAQDPTKAVRIYLATISNPIVSGGAEMDAGIYNVNNAATGAVTFSGHPTIDGMVITNSFSFSGNPIINSVQGYFFPTGGQYYYACALPWQELSQVF